MSRLAVASFVALWAGVALLLSASRWARRPTLVDRLAPHAPGAVAAERDGGVLSGASFREVLGPLAAAVGGRLARAFGSTEDLTLRLARIRSPLDPTAFRLRQLGGAGAALAAGVAVATATSAGHALALLAVAGSPLLAFLISEQRLASASAARQRRLFLELPVVTEQLAMLLGAGFSLGAAMARVAARGSGVCAADLAEVTARVRHGLTEARALAEWAALAGVPALDRVVAVLALEREAGDLGRLLSEEARQVRREVHRELLARLDRRQQQVWVPVTVATLVPGVIFLSIPFVEALRLFSGS